MSDNWIIVIPENPDFIPSETAQKKAIELFKRFAPDAVEIKTETSTHIRLIDCGGNLERIICPQCSNEVSFSWWEERTDEEAEKNFPLRAHTIPCCGAQIKLNELKYDWPQGFARFSLEAMNAGIPALTTSQLETFGTMLGCKVRQILQHL